MRGKKKKKKMMMMMMMISPFGSERQAQVTDLHSLAIVGIHSLNTRTSPTVSCFGWRTGYILTQSIKKSSRPDTAGAQPVGRGTAERL